MKKKVLQHGTLRVELVGACEEGLPEGPACAACAAFALVDSDALTRVGSATPILSQTHGLEVVVGVPVGACCDGRTAGD